MGQIRSQGLLATVITYLGFVLGALNIMFLFPKFLTKEAFGLTRLFADLSQSVFALSSLGIAVLHRFYPYYEARLSLRDNDLFSWLFALSILVSLPSLALVLVVYGSTGGLFVAYRAYLPFMALGMVAFMITEAYAVVLGRSVFTSFLRELWFRAYQLFWFGLYVLGYLSFEGFFLGFVSAYLTMFVLLLLHLWRLGLLHWCFRVSKLTRRLKRPILHYGAFAYLWYMLSLLVPTLDGLMIGHWLGLPALAVFSLADYVSRLLLVPQRSLAWAALAELTRAWRLKDLGRIGRIYSRSALVQLLAGLFLFSNIWFNLDWGLTLLPSGYEAVKGPLFLLAMAKLLDLAFGCSNEMVYTSPFWRYNVYAYLLLLFVYVPLNAYLIQAYGLMGAACAGLTAYACFNLWRAWLIWWNVGLQPFSWRHLALLGLALGLALPVHYGLQGAGLFWGLLRSVCFSLPYLALAYWFNLSEDLTFFVHKLRRIIGFRAV